MTEFVRVCLGFIQDIDNLQWVWEITQDWNANWDIWKAGQFATLETGSMETTTLDLFKKIQKVQRELKVFAQRPPDFSPLPQQLSYLHNL